MANELENNNENKNDQNNDQKSLEERIKQLEAENGKLRQANTNASAEAAKFKRELGETKDKLNAKLSDEEKAKQDQEAVAQKMQEELEALRKERNVANYTSALVAQDIGMDADTAKAVAEALNSGDVEKVFDGVRKFIAAHDKLLKENAFRTNPTLQGGTPPKTVTKEQFDKMGYTERLKVFNDYPDLYKEFTK